MTNGNVKRVEYWMPAHAEKRKAAHTVLTLAIMTILME
jgi:hypothetical protein